MGLCWVWQLNLQKSCWIILKLHNRTKFKVSIVLYPSLLKIGLWRLEKGHRATWHGKYHQKTNLPPYFTTVIPSDPAPGGQGPSWSLRIIDSWGLDRLWDRVSTQGHSRSLVIAPIKLFRSFVESSPEDWKLMFTKKCRDKTIVLFIGYR